MAETGWREYLEKDPFYGDIAPSLLTSHDIHQYGSLGCLVSNYERKRLLPAGYQMSFLGDLIYWEPKKGGRLKRIESSAKEGQEIVLPRNSIMYLHMAEEFRMPQYIAARFNLRITHVHQGLLLGTGPLIDPGFEGRIMIPLHNLTDNDYIMTGGESLIHVEFTKVNELPRWEDDSEIDESKDNYRPFKKDKIKKSPNQYFDQSQVLANGGVVSNLASVLAEARQLNESAQRTLKIYQLGGLAAALALFIGTLSLVISTNSVLQGVQETAEQAEKAVASAMVRLEASSTAIENQPEVEGPFEMSPEEMGNDQLPAVDETQPSEISQLEETQPEVDEGEQQE